jgi:hypothetical protein
LSVPRPAWALVLVIVFAVATRAAATPAPSPVPGAVTVTLDHPSSAFRPDRALGAALDGHEHGDTPIIYTRPNLRAMRSAGLVPVTYRLRTELGVEAWHWQPRGRWSDARHRRGYWTSSSRAGRRIEVSYGYRLPRRGDTIDQANDSGYSRLDDGTTRTFWKSDPYLDRRYTGESNARHPQWILFDLGRPAPIDALRLDWGRPYARRFRVQYWTGPQAIFLAGHPPGEWRDFPRGPFTGRGGRQTVRIATAPLRVRFVRVVMTRGSRTAPRGATDVRDRLGYAVREVGLGELRGRRFVDRVRHEPRGSRQTSLYVSSTDPWHRARDLDRNYEQPGFDRVATSGLLRGRPLLVPVSVLYGTPANAVAELRYLRARHIAVRGVELGEEPDGQLVTPEDYGVLYAEFARRLHHAFPRLAIGGPSFQTSIPDWVTWPDARGNRSWTNRFLAELRAQHALRLLRFFSFEWYPFDNVCGDPARQLLSEPDLLAGVLRRQAQAGLPPSLPKLITEYGFSAFAGQAEVDLPGALLNADLVGQFLSLGGTAAYLYGYEPDALIRESSSCNTWGNLTLFLSNFDRRILYRMPTYYGARLLARYWALPGDGRHLVYPASTTVRDAAGREVVTAYAVLRPDGRVALALINKDPTRTFALRIGLMRGGGPVQAPGGLDTQQLSPARYVWHADGQRGHPRPDLSPAPGFVAPGAAPTVEVPPYSLTVALTRDPVPGG